MPHKQGGKITKSHATVIEAALPVIKRAEQLPEVTKVVLGFISRQRRGRRRLKFTQTNSGWKVMVGGSAGVQEIFVYTSDPEGTRDALEEVFK